MKKSLIEILSKRTYQEEQSIIDGNIDDYYYQDNSKTVKIKKNDWRQKYWFKDTYPFTGYPIN